MALNRKKGKKVSRVQSVCRSHVLFISTRAALPPPTLHTLVATLHDCTIAPRNPSCSSTSNPVPTLACPNGCSSTPPPLPLPLPPPLPLPLPLLPPLLPLLLLSLPLLLPDAPVPAPALALPVRTPAPQNPCQ